MVIVRKMLAQRGSVLKSKYRERKKVQQEG
jgi:hypothetical protein